MARRHLILQVIRGQWVFFLPEQVVHGPRWTVNLALLLYVIPLHTIQQQVPCLSKLALVSNNFGSPITGLRNSSALIASIFRPMRIVFLSTQRPYFEGHFLNIKSRLDTGATWRFNQVNITQTELFLKDPALGYSPQLWSAHGAP